MNRSFLGFALALLVAACGDTAGRAGLPTAPVPPGMAAQGSVTGTGPIVWSDKEDYVPHEATYFGGSGWQPGETITLTFVEDPVVHGAQTFTTVADDSGHFAFEGFRPEDHHAGVRFTLTATGQSSGLQAQTTFTDAIAVDGTSTNSNGSTGTGSQQITISAPAVSANDVLIANIAIADAITSTVVCAPAGWTSIGNNTFEDKIRLHTFWLRASAAAGATSHTFQFRSSCPAGSLIGAGTKGASGGITRFTGVVTAGDPIDISAGSSATSSGPFSAPNVTTTTAGAHITRYFAVFKNTNITHGTAPRIHFVGSSVTKERAIAVFNSGSLGVAGNTDTLMVTLESSAEVAAQTIALKMAAVAAPTTLTVASATGTFGGSANLSATLTLTSGGTAVSGKTIAFTLNGSSAGSAVTNASGIASISAASLTAINAGSYPTGVAASFAGDATHAMSSGTAALTVSQAPQAIVFTSTAPSGAVVGGPTYSVTATGGGSGNPVVFTSNTPAVCSVTGGNTVNMLAQGTCTINANQAGNTNYLAAAQVQQSFSIGKVDQTITFEALGNKTFGDAPFTVSATATSGLPVSFAVGVTDNCTIAGTTVTITGAGTCTVTASQAGNGTYNAAPNVNRQFNIAQAAQTIVFTSTAPSGAVVGGPTYSVTATGGGSGNPVVFTSNTPAVCSVTGGNTVNMLAQGTCTINANQAGNTNYLAAAQVQQSFGIAPADESGPVVSNILATPNPVAAGQSTTITANISDVTTGNSNIASAQYSLNGGAAWSGYMTAADGLFNSPSENVRVTLTLALGVYKICVSGTDAAGNVSDTHVEKPEDACTLLAVYDPTAGFVTGGGWISSPSGACRLTYVCETLGGKANFGFVSKYKKGMTVPEGSTEFQFHAGDLNFKSAVYEWLVVSGSRAQYKGTGTINGAGNYGFLLTSVDGQLNGGGGIDRFRIKIWDITDGGKIVYDNEMNTSDTATPTTAIGGGSIVIHAK